MSIEFLKMHGLGNDFIFINQSNLDKKPNNELITKIIDRKLGIGCDQLIIFKKIDSCHYTIEIYNPDGTKAGMCGNAMRCLGLHAFEETGQRLIYATVNERKIQIETISAKNIKVNMGKANFQAQWMPNIVKISEAIMDYQLNLKEIICVDIGNPHIVIFYETLSTPDKELLGRIMQYKNLFPDGVNVNFAKIQDEYIKLKVFERGAGFTLACGSGACATFAAAHKLKFITNNATIKFEFGNLKMSYLNEDIIMAGSAQKVATGRYYGY